MVETLGAEVVEGECEPAQVLGAQGGSEVEAVGELLGALDHAGEAADQDVGDSLAIECGQDRVGVERWLFNAHVLRLCLRAFLEESLDAPFW